VEVEGLAYLMGELGIGAGDDDAILEIALRLDPGPSGGELWPELIFDGGAYQPPKFPFPLPPVSSSQIPDVTPAL